MRQQDRVKQQLDCKKIFENNKSISTNIITQKQQPLEHLLFQLNKMYTYNG